MKVDVETLSPVQKRLQIEVPWDTVKEELDLAYKGLAKRAKVKGFRAGHVPRPVLEKLYRKAVEGEVVGRLMDESYKKAVLEKALTPINSPIVAEEPRIETDAPFRFVATVEVKPEVKAEHYKGLEITRDVRVVSDAEVDKELEGLRQKAVAIEPVKGRDTAQAGDLAVIDFFGEVGGKDFKGGKGISYTVEIGARRMIPGFEDQLVGMKVGEHKTFRVPFPKDDGPDEVRGKEVDWSVDLKELKQKILPDLDDELAKDLGEYESLAELRAKIKENLGTREDARSKRMIRDRALEKLVALNPVDVPPVMVERQLDFLLQEVERMTQTNKEPEIARAIGKLREESRPRAGTQVAGMLLLEAIGRAEGIEVGEAELDRRLQDIARENKMKVTDVKTQLKRDGRLDAVRYDMRQEKALDFVVQNAVIKEQVVAGPAPEDEHHDHDHG